MIIIEDIVFLVAGLFLLIKGADLFVDASSDIARYLKIPSFIIALTLVAFGTSAPEIAVSGVAAVNNSTDLSYGNAVGSNMINFYIAIGASAFIMTLSARKKDMFFEVMYMTFITIVLIVFSFLITPKVIDRFEGIILLLLFVVFIVVLVYKGLKNNKKNKTDEKSQKPDNDIFSCVLLVIVGLIMIILGGEYVTDSATSLAVKIGMSEFLVGLTITALGTSAPEIITSIIAVIKKEGDIAVGNVIGSNITNITVALGLAGSIRAIPVSTGALVDLIALFIGCIFLIYIIFSHEKIGKIESLILIFAYLFYLVFIILRN